MKLHKNPKPSLVKIKSRCCENQKHNNKYNNKYNRILLRNIQDQISSDLINQIFLDQKTPRCQNPKSVARNISIADENFVPRKNSVARKELRPKPNSLKRNLTLRKESNLCLHAETIHIVAYWNSFSSLVSHKINGRRKPLLHKQSKTIQNIDKALQKLTKGTFYSKQDEVQAGMRKHKWTMIEIKKSIKRMALACTPEYTTATKKVPLLNFLLNVHMTFGKGPDRYKFKYPFLHFVNNEPVPLSDTPFKRKTEYPIIVDRVIKILATAKKPTDKQYNQVVKQIDKAMLFIKKVSNGNLAENRARLPILLKDTMIEQNLPLSIDNLPLGVHNLETYMRKRLMVQ
jgi:hypothetical protein